MPDKTEHGEYRVVKQGESYRLGTIWPTTGFEPAFDVSNVIDSDPRSLRKRIHDLIDDVFEKGSVEA